VDLRRLRCGDPAADALAAAFARREMACGWTVNVEREDVCPVLRLGDNVATIDDYLATLSKKERHEVRRKVRRSEAAGDTLLVDSKDPVADLDAFIELHQKRWGADGLFPDTAGGQASRTFFRRLFELFGGDSLRLSFLEVGGRRVAAGVWFQDDRRSYYFNAGVDPEAKAISPGVVMVERFVRRAIEEGRPELDFLRGDEGYKYMWGAVDEPIQRVLVRRTED
jgi:CelD/BcsL family acetyltransferase involved in cellulose biosynthesis